jgi:hypothetical protein
MLANVEDVIRWLELQELEFWTVSLTKDEGNTKVFDWKEEETLESRKQRFRDTMRLSQGGRYYIKAKRNKTDGRGIFLEEFSNMPNNQPAQQATIGSIGIAPDEVERRISEALEKAERQREMKELKEQNQELLKAIKESDSVSNRFMQKLEPFIGMIVPALVNKLIPGQQLPAVSIASVESNYSEETNDMEENNQNEQRIETALIKWSNADPDFVELLEAIAEMAASGDQTYKMAKGFLKK